MAETCLFGLEYFFFFQFWHFVTYRKASGLCSWHGFVLLLNVLLHNWKISFIKWFYCFDFSKTFKKLRTLKKIMKHTKKKNKKKHNLIKSAYNWKTLPLDPSTLLMGCLNCLAKATITLSKNPWCYPWQPSNTREKDWRRYLFAQGSRKADALPVLFYLL